jgi:hypothetical protein
MENSPTVLGMRTSRRELLKKVAYVTPVVLTLAATPAFAGKGSGVGKSRSFVKARWIEKGPKKY